ncbi:MAG: ribosome-binding factor A [Alphaproteobacteria bacterium]
MKVHSPKSKSQRQLRVSESIKRVLADQLSKGDFVAEYEGEIVTFAHPITITQVRISPDLQQAIVSVMPLGGVDKEEAVVFLNKMARTLRMFLGRHLNTRFTPSLKFVIDETFDQATRIESLLRQVSNPAEPTEK